MILVMGAGAVGCWLGGCLRAGGADVLFVARPPVLDALREHGLTVTDLDGRHERLAPDALKLHDTVPSVAPELVLLTVKSVATQAAAAQLAAALPAGTPVVSLQNGVSNTQTAQAAAPLLTVLSGMVPYNIVPLGPGHYHRGSSGTLAVQEHPATRQALPAFRNAGLALELVADMKPLLWGKLLLNLNNPVNALSGLPLRAELMDSGYRRGLAALQKEALAVLDRAGIAPAKVGTVPPRKAPLLLRLPTPVFRLLAARMLRIDEHARSSMADDLAHKRPTEIDALCGEVVRLAHSVGMDAPLNEKMVELVNWPRTAPMSSRQLRAALNV